MIIDAHVHLLSPKNREDAADTFLAEGDFLYHEMSVTHEKQIWQRASFENLMRVMEDTEIDGAVVFGFPWRSSDRCRWDNEYVANCCQLADGKLWWLAVFQPYCGQTAVDELYNCLSDPHMLGVKIKAQFQGFSLTEDGLLRPFLEEVCRHEKIALIHVQQPINASYGNGPFELLTLAKHFPDVKIIAAHYGGMLGMYSAYLPVREMLSNVFYDTALGVTAGEVAAAYSNIGLGDKVLFGSDFPMHSPGKIITDLKHTLDEEILEKVLGGNFYAGIVNKKRLGA